MIEVLRELADKIQVLECQTLDLQPPFSCWAQLKRGSNDCRHCWALAQLPHLTEQEPEG